MRNGLVTGAVVCLVALVAAGTALALSGPGAGFVSPDKPKSERHLLGADGSWVEFELKDNRFVCRAAYKPFGRTGLVEETIFSLDAEKLAATVGKPQLDSIAYDGTRVATIAVTKAEIDGSTIKRVEYKIGVLMI